MAQVFFAVWDSFGSNVICCFKLIRIGAPFTGIGSYFFSLYRILHCSATSISSYSFIMGALPTHAIRGTRPQVSTLHCVAACARYVAIQRWLRTLINIDTIRLKVPPVATASLGCPQTHSVPSALRSLLFLQTLECGHGRCHIIRSRYLGIF